MSYILNALRKSEQARRALQGEVKPELLVTPVKTGGALRTVSAVMLLGLLVVNVLLGLYWLGTLSTSAITPEVQAQPSTPPAMVAPVIAIAPTASALDTPPSRAIATSPDIPVDTPAISELWTEQQRAQAEEHVNELAAAKVMPPPTLKPSPKPMLVKPTGVPVTKPVAKAASHAELRIAVDEFDAPEPRHNPLALVREVEAEPDNEPESRSRVPWLNDLPSDFQTRTALGSITVFAYADAPHDRFIIMDKVKYTIGQRIKQNASIVDILPTYVLLQFEGQSFRLPRP